MPTRMARRVFEVDIRGKNWSQRRPQREQDVAKGSDRVGLWLNFSVPNLDYVNAKQRLSPTI